MTANRPNVGLYVHIPFCAAKCSYCDFYSLAHREDKMDDYCAALTEHLREVAPRMAGQQVDTVYFGGGTPSYLGPKRLSALLKTIRKCYALTADAEITLEANPDSAGDVKALKMLRKAGFNRLSLGAQAMDDDMLRAIGRIHTAQQVKEAVSAARSAGFQNISIDLMYGLPGQTMAHWQQTLMDAVALGTEHVSAYGLKVEEGTPLWQRRDSADLPDDEAQADMYLWAVEALAAAGYGQYEISNFARPGFESRHNLRYWRMAPYAGFGPGAHSDFGNVRFAYEKDLDGYLAGDMRLSEREEILPRERCMEYIMLSLRTAEGISRATVERTYRKPFAQAEAVFRELAEHGLAEATEAGWRLTPRGFLVSNAIILQVQQAVFDAQMAR